MDPHDRIGSELLEVRGVLSTHFMTLEFTFTETFIGVHLREGRLYFSYHVVFLLFLVLRLLGLLDKFAFLDSVAVDVVIDVCDPLCT